MPAKTRYSIRAVPLADAKDDLLRVWRRSLSLATDGQRKFDWLYVEAPRAPEVVFVLDADDEVVGTAGIGVRRFHVGQRHLDVAMLVDLAVDPEHRSLLPALQLVRAVREHVLATMGVGYGFPNKRAIGVFLRARYKKLGTFARYSRVIRHQPYLDRIVTELKLPPVCNRALELPLAANVVGRMLDLGRVAADMPKIASATARYRLESSQQADERIDQVWSRAHSGYAVVAERSTRFLAWRFANLPVTYHYLCDRSRSGQALAYAVSTVEDDVFVLRDFYGKLQDLGPLLDRLVPRAVAAGVRAITLRFLGDPRVVEVLASRGFREAETERSVLYAAAADLDDAFSSFRNVESWYLTDLDEDE